MKNLILYIFLLGINVNAQIVTKIYDWPDYSLLINGTIKLQKIVNNLSVCVGHKENNNEAFCWFIDITIPDAPVLKKELALPQGPYSDLCVSDNYIYLSKNIDNRYSEIIVIDKTDNDNPFINKVVPLSHQISKFFVKDNLLIANDSMGLTLLFFKDLSTANDEFLNPYYQITCPVYRFKVSAQMLLAVGNDEEGCVFNFYDLSDYQNPTWINKFYISDSNSKYGFSNPGDFIIDNNHVIFTVSHLITSDIGVMDISDLWNPIIIDTKNYEIEFFKEIVMYNNYLYVRGGWNNPVYSENTFIFSKTNLSLLKTIDLLSYPVISSSILSSVIDGELVIFSLSDPLNPVAVYNKYPGEIEQVSASSDSYLVHKGDTTLLFLRPDRADDLECVLEFDNTTYIDDLLCQDDVLFLFSGPIEFGGNSLQTYDISTPGEMNLLQEFYMPYDGMNGLSLSKISNNMLFFMNSYSWDYKFFDISNPKNIKNIDLPEGFSDEAYVVDFASKDTTAYFLMSNKQLVVYQCDNLDYPQKLSTLSVNWDKIDIINNQLYVKEGQNFHVFDISAPENFQELGSGIIDNLNNYDFNSMFLFNDSDSLFFDIWSIQDPGDYRKIESLDDYEGIPVKLKVVDNTLIINNGEKISIYNIPLTYPVLYCSTNQLWFDINEGDQNPISSFSIKNVGAGSLNYTIHSDQNWIVLDTDTGISIGEENRVNVTIDTSTLDVGVHIGNITVQSSDSLNSPQNIYVTCLVNGAVPDTQPPSIPAIITGFYVGDESITLQWQASTDNTGVKYYAIYRGEDNSLVGTTSDTQITVSGFSNSMMYRFKIKAFDYYGNSSAFSKEIVVAPAGLDQEPPTTPAMLVGVGLDATTIRLSWEASQDDVAVKFYAIYRSEDNRFLGTTPYTSYVLKNLEQGVTYKYKIKAWDYFSKKSEFSNEVQVRTWMPDSETPSIPQNFQAFGYSDSEILLRWEESTDNLGVRFYAVYNYEDNVLLGTSYTTELLLRGLNEDTDYTFRIKAFDFNNNRSKFSNIATSQTLKPDNSAPSAPANLNGDVLSGTQIRLSWNPSFDDQGVRFYAIYSGSNNTLVGTTWDTEYLIYGLIPSTEYSYRIKAFDFNDNRSPFSNEVTVMTDSQGIITISNTSFTPYCFLGNSPDPQTFTIQNTGTSVLNYQINTDVPWIQISPLTGQNSGAIDTITISYEVTAMEPDIYHGTISIEDPLAVNPSEIINVTLVIAEVPSLILIPSGTYQMGSESGEANEYPVNTVSINTFYIGQFELTAKDYLAFCEATGYQKSSLFNIDSLEQPVSVSWWAANAYCEWLTEHNPGIFYMPSEAEWEYACRAGSNTEYYWGDAFDDNYCWYEGNSLVGNTHPVGEKLPNSWDLYDMSGNAWEWCSDSYSQYAYIYFDHYDINESGNPIFTAYSVSKPNRGGSVSSYSFGCRSSERSAIAPNMNAGFRIARTFEE